jgi:hypothetical protein
MVDFGFPPGSRDLRQARPEHFCNRRHSVLFRGLQKVRERRPGPKDALSGRTQFKLAALYVINISMSNPAMQDFSIRYPEFSTNIVTRYH